MLKVIKPSFSVTFGKPVETVDFEKRGFLEIQHEAVNFGATEAGVVIMLVLSYFTPETAKLIMDSAVKYAEQSKYTFGDDIRPTTVH